MQRAAKLQPHPKRHLMRAARTPRSVVFGATALVIALALLVWFTVVVQQAQTRGQHRLAYQQMTGEIMMPIQAVAHRNANRRPGANQATAAVRLAQQ